MSVTIEIYAAKAQQLIHILACPPVSEDDEQFFQQLEKFPHADFSMHLLIPDDLDRLCLALRQFDAMFPATFRELLQQQLWFDEAESLTLLADELTMLFVTLSEKDVEALALEWSKPFAYTQALQATPAYKALSQLREIARFAQKHGKALILYLLGSF